MEKEARLTITRKEPGQWSAVRALDSISNIFTHAVKGSVAHRSGRPPHDAKQNPLAVKCVNAVDPCRCASMLTIIFQHNLQPLAGKEYTALYRAEGQLHLVGYLLVLVTGHMH